MPQSSSSHDVFSYCRWSFCLSVQVNCMRLLSTNEMDLKKIYRNVCVSAPRKVMYCTIKHIRDCGKPLAFVQLIPTRGVSFWFCSFLFRAADLSVFYIICMLGIWRNNKGAKNHSAMRSKGEKRRLCIFIKGRMVEF